MHKIFIFLWAWSIYLIILPLIGVDISLCNWRYHVKDPAPAAPVTQKDDIQMKFFQKFVKC